MSDETASEQGWLADGTRGRRGTRRLGLSLAWCLAEPARIGEVALLPPGRRAVLGRGAALPDDGCDRLVFARLRPGGAEARPPLVGNGLSRVQLRFDVAAGVLTVRNEGRAKLFVNGRLVSTTPVPLAVGDVLHVERLLLLLVVEREGGDVSSRSTPPSFAFGAPDPFGLVGESPRLWALRDELDFLARRAGHALLLGASGSGKELCARALHGLSARSKGPFVARNAATLPPGLIDAELFGNAKNYPHAGLPARAGLLGEAEGGTLFLDEIAELPEELQAHLLRVLDQGEYHRLGDERAKRADVRFVGATNRDPSALKHDLLARFAVRIAVPGLGERREDIPLLVHALLTRHARRDADIRERFFEGESPRLEPRLVEGLLGFPFTTHVRELETLLVSSMATSRGSFLALSASVEAALAPATDEARPRTPGEIPSAEAIEAALRDRQGNVSQAWRDLGLSSRDTLRRLMKKYGLPKS